MQDKLLDAVGKAKLGDLEASTDLYNLTERMVYFTALKIVANEDDALDIVQETYVKVFSGLSTLRDDEAFISWVKLIVTNLSRDFMKKKRPVLFETDEDEARVLGSVPEVSEDFLPEHYADRRETSRLVMKIVDALPEVQRVTVMLYYYNGYSVSEVAEYMEVSEGTVKSRLNYARLQIRDEVEKLEKEGTKLYAIPVFMLSRILQNASLDYNLPQTVSDRILADALAVAAEVVAVGAAAGGACAAGTAGTAGGAGAAGAGGVSAGGVTGAGGAAGVAGGATTAGGATAAGGAAGGAAGAAVSTGLIVKICAGIVAAAVVVGGGLLIFGGGDGDDEVDQPVYDTSSELQPSAEASSSDVSPDSAGLDDPGGEPGEQKEPAQDALVDMQLFLRNLLAAYETEGYEAIYTAIATLEYELLRIRVSERPVIYYVQEGAYGIGWYGNFIYIGDYAGEIRSGSGFWISLRNPDELKYWFEGEWANDMPNGMGTAFSYLPLNRHPDQYYYGMLVDGLWDGSMTWYRPAIDAQITFFLSNGKYIVIGEPVFNEIENEWYYPVAHGGDRETDGPLVVERVLDELRGIMGFTT